MTTLLKAEHLTKIYGSKKHPVKALDDISLEIVSGRSLALIGESGSGKTTFGKVICGLERADRGSVQLMGTSMQGLSERRWRPYRRHIQMIFQSSLGVFDPEYTIGDSIREVCQNFYRLSGRECTRKVEAALMRVGLPAQYKDRYVSSLSGGECQRANIARALVLEPELVVCDEPVSSLDYSIRKQILDLLNEIQRNSNVTYLLITHDLSNVPYLCREVCIMYRGQIVEMLDDTMQLPEKIRHPYSRQLFHSVPAADPAKRTISHPPLQAEAYALQEQASDGCPYHLQCPDCMPLCRSQAPPVSMPRPGHYIRCHAAG